jgi:hypothetical protein
MKTTIKFLIINILICLLNQTLFCQTTPKGTTIPANLISYPSPHTQATINSINTYVTNTYPNAIKLENPTTAYNCHNYAWVKSTGGGSYWLNTPGDDLFWNDNSYLQTSNTTAPNIRVSNLVTILQLQ